MGVNISTASPQPDGTTLENYNGSWRVVPGANILKEVYSYTLPSALGSASSFIISDITTRYALDKTKKYKLYLKITTGSSVTLNEFGLFSEADVLFKLINTSTNANIPYDEFTTGVYIDVTYKAVTNVFSLNGVIQTVYLMCDGCVKNLENSLRLAFSGATTITDLSLKLYESDMS